MDTGTIINGTGLGWAKNDGREQNLMASPSPSFCYAYYLPESRDIVPQNVIYDFALIESDRARARTIRLNQQCQQIIAGKCWVFLMKRGYDLTPAEAEKFIADHSPFDQLVYAYSFTDDKSYGPYSELDELVINHIRCFPSALESLTKGV